MLTIKHRSDSIFLNVGFLEFVSKTESNRGACGYNFQDWRIFPNNTKCIEFIQMIA